MIVNMRIYLDFSRKLFTLSVVIYQTAITCEVTGHQTKIGGGPFHLPRLFFCPSVRQKQIGDRSNSKISKVILGPFQTNLDQYEPEKDNN